MRAMSPCPPGSLLAALLLAACGSSQAPPLVTTAPVPVSIVSSAAAQSGCTAARAPRHHAQQLRHEGRWLVDPLGRVTLLHGLNAVWKTPPYVPPATAEGFTARDAAFFADHGFNTARIGTLFTGVMPEPGQIDSGYLDAWDRVVQLMAAQKIWMLFDFHQDLYNEAFQGEGFPPWAVYDYLPPVNTSTQGFPLNYFTPPTKQQFDNLLLRTATPSGADLWDGYRDAWKAVAARWKNQPYSLGYDLMNEPWPGSSWASCANPGLGCPVQEMQLQGFFEHALAGIRSVDAQNLVWFEPFLTFDFGGGSALASSSAVSSDPGVGFSWHSYCLPGVFAHAQGGSDIPSCPALHDMVFANAETVRSRLAAATLLTEFGASDDLADLRQVTERADTNLVGWQYWHYKNWRDPTTESQTTSAQSLFTNDEDLGSLKIAKAKILVRAYPQSVAGIPLALGFDPDTASMNFSYQPRLTGGPTEIYVPVALHYPKGYRVELKGAEASLADGGRRLLLREQPGACQVDVRIQPVG